MWVCFCGNAHILCISKLDVRCEPKGKVNKGYRRGTTSISKESEETRTEKDRNFPCVLER